MKKLSSCIIFAGLTVPMASTAMAEGPIDGTIYGKINTAIISHDNGATDEVRMVNNASRLGIKGKTDLDDAMSVVYKLEYEIAPDESAADKGGSGIFKQRNAYVGLGTSVGTFLAGRHDTPLKSAQGKIDLFNDLQVGDIKNIVNGEERISNIFIYRSPEFNNLQVEAATQFEDDPAKDDGTSVSLKYNRDNLYVAAAVDSKVDGMDVVRLAGQYKLDALTVGAILNQSEASSGGSAENGFIVSGSYKVDSLTLKAQVASSDEKAKGGQQVALGVDKKLGKKTKAFVYFAQVEDDVNAKKSASGVGLEHKF
ncbi:MAG: porin [Gammaproteobacteria bacterium]